MLKPIIDFSKRHVLGSISLVLSVVLSAGSRAIDVYHLFDLGLPAGMWEVIGLLVFFITIVVLFARFENSMTVGAKVSPSELSAPVPGIGRTPSSSAMVIAVVLSLLGGCVLGGFADNAINKPSRVHRFGPRTAINLTHTLKPAIERIPGVPPWHILFTNANGNEIVAGDVKSVLTLSTRNIESIPMPNYKSDINAPRFRGGSLSGLCNIMGFRSRG